jgi:hypothetical protein
VDQKKRIEDYFAYKWNMDRTIAISSESDKSLLEQLPQDVQNRIYKDFLFSTFIRRFRHFLQLKNMQSKHKHAYLNWESSVYSNFMRLFLGFLEPVTYPSGAIIYNEFDNVTLVNFIYQGQVDIGYDINRMIRYKMRLKGNFQIGGFECSYCRRSQLIYKASKRTEGYFIRRKNWSALEEESPDLYNQIKKKCLYFYDRKIRRIMNKTKLEDINTINQRHDYLFSLTMRGDLTPEINHLLADAMVN